MFVFSNLATSLDGKISPKDRAHYLIGTPADRKQMLVLRRQCDAILFGASTLRGFQRACAVKDLTKQPLNVVLSRALEDLSPEWPFFSDTRIERLFFVTETPSLAAQEKIQATSQWILLDSQPGAKPIAVQMIQHLEKRGIRQLLVEGGGGVMWHFASQNLIDEYNVTLTPKIIGGTKAPTLVDGEGFLGPEILNLKLKSCRTLENELYLVYSKTDIRG